MPAGPTKRTSERCTGKGAATPPVSAPTAATAPGGRRPGGKAARRRTSDARWRDQLAGRHHARRIAASRRGTHAAGALAGGRHDGHGTVLEVAALLEHVQRHALRQHGAGGVGTRGRLDVIGRRHRHGLAPRALHGRHFGCGGRPPVDAVGRSLVPVLAHVRPAERRGRAAAQHGQEHQYPPGSVHTSPISYGCNKELTTETQRHREDKGKRFFFFVFSSFVFVFSVSLCLCG